MSVVHGNFRCTTYVYPVQIWFDTALCTLYQNADLFWQEIILHLQSRRNWDCKCMEGRWIVGLIGWCSRKSGLLRRNLCPISLPSNVRWEWHSTVAENGRGVAWNHPYQSNKGFASWVLSRNLSNTHWRSNAFSEEMGGKIEEWAAISLALSWTRVTVKRTIRHQIINTLPAGRGDGK